MHRASLFLLTAALAAPISAQHTFAVGDSAFLLDGRPFQILAGEMHYPRIPREDWRQRFRMAKAMGLNTVSAYVFWNVHEPRPGVFDFAGNADVAEFVREAGQEGLWVVLRPGPYVCAEWEFGGYPSWLLKAPAVRVREDNPAFIAAVDRYLDALGKQLAPLQVTHGGPILMVQVENEYGSYGSDKVYLGKLRDAVRHAGFDVPLYTADGIDEVPAGSLEGTLPALTGGDAGSALDLIRKYHPKGPFFLAEFYPGWLDHWGEPHQRVATAPTAAAYDSLLSHGVSVSLYMFHGGTDWGFTAGANYDDHYQPQPTSYDYDAPLDESGRPTPKYYALRDVIRRHLPAGASLPAVPNVAPPISVARFPLPERAGLSSLLRAPVRSPTPLAMEDLGQAYGYVLYRTRVPRAGTGVLRIRELRDYGIVFVDGKRVAELDRRDHQDSAVIAIPRDSSRLEILVENTGRINYGSRIPANRQGITDSVTFAGAPLSGWDMFALPFDHPERAAFSRKPGTGPALYRGTFTLARTGDTFLDLRGWGKGNVWVNGHNLGRYWYIGPQQTLYVPGPWLKVGANQVIVLDLEDGEKRTLAGLATPILDQLRPEHPALHPGLAPGVR
ncbi:MAG TPA: glycoside hydrolase family 35 protein [Gemmatimonadales bacterium]|nr:glycoside hydrolase family 35 protein [Gemmatimonadales bacterium]